MTITRVGTNEKYASGWESAFGKGKKSNVPQPATAKKTAGKAVKKAAAKKSSSATAAKGAKKSKSAPAKKQTKKK